MRISPYFPANQRRAYCIDMYKALLIVTLLAWAPFSEAENDLNLDSYDGKVVVVDFWASWCVPCRRSFPWMNEMQAKYSEQGLIILAINVDRKAENAAAFLQKYPAHFKVIYDAEAELAKEFNVEVMPSSIIIGRDGEVVERHTGFKVKRQAEYEEILRAALHEED